MQCSLHCSIMDIPENRGRVEVEKVVLRYIML